MAQSDDNGDDDGDGFCDGVCCCSGVGACCGGEVWVSLTVLKTAPARYQK